MIEFTEEELERLAPNDDILPLVNAAAEAGDREEEIRQFKRLVLPAGACLTLKATHGAEEVRNGGYNVSEAQLRFGPDWLEKDDDELVKLFHGW